MVDMTQDKGHLNGLCRALGIRPECREKATDREIRFARIWMRLRAQAYREQVEHEMHQERTDR